MRSSFSLDALIGRDKRAASCLSSRWIFCRAACSFSCTTGRGSSKVKPRCLVGEMGCDTSDSGGACPPGRIKAPSSSRRDCSASTVSGCDSRLLCASSLATWARSVPISSRYRANSACDSSRADMSPSNSLIDARTRTCLIRRAKLSVPRLSSTITGDGFSVHTTAMRARPLRLFCRMRVSLESRNGTCPTFFSDRAKITLPKLSRLLLMLPPSVRRCDVCVECRSEPARSMSDSSLTRYGRVVLGSRSHDSIVILKQV